MKAMLEWMADNHVATNLFMIFIIFIGFMSLKTVNVEVFPEVANDMVQIQVPYPGASPDEIEESINVKIEEQLKSLEGIDRITSTANENVGVVNAELSLGEDVTEMKDKIKSEIDRIITFPENAEEPIVKEALRKVEVIQVAVYGAADELTRKQMINKVRDDLLEFEEISQISLEAVREYEISINVSEEKLRAYNLTFDQVTQAIRMGSLDLPGGKVTTKTGEILLRTKALGYKKSDYENIILSSDLRGTTLRIKDVAEVIDGFEDSDLVASFNGQPVAMAKIFRVGDESAVGIADAVHSYIASVENDFPEGVKISAWRDQSRILKSRIDLLVTNAMQGLALVIICLALFLEIRLAMWVTVGIVISFVGSFFFMSAYDASINMISLFAFILVIGIVVDDAIVVGENVFTFREAGYSPADSAKKGVVQVMTPVFFSVSTSIVAFSPLLFVDGFMGKFMRVIPIIVIAVLILSLIESLMILPAHLGSIKKTPAWKITNYFHGINEKIHAKLETYIQGSYTAFLRKALEFRYLTAAGSIFIFLFSVGVIVIGLVKFTFFPNIEADNIVARITMPVGTPLETTQNYVKRIEDAAFLVQQEFDGKRVEQKASIFRNIYSVIGDQPMIRQSGGDNGGAVVIIQSNIAEINVELLPSEQREFNALELTERWRELVGPLSGVKTLTFQSNLMSAGNDVQIELSTRNFDDLMVVLDSLKTQLAREVGVNDIRDDFLAGKMEYKLKLKPEAAPLGVTQALLARQVRQAFYGDEAMRIQRGKDEIKVMIRYPKKNRNSVEDIRNMRIRTPLGGEIPFYNVAEVEVGRGYSAIKRADAKRVVSLIADVDEAIADANEINGIITNKLIPELQKTYPDLTYGFQGGQKQQQKAVSSMGRGFIIALFIIFTLLAIPFKSYIQPLVVMSAIPFGLVGAVWGHVVFGMDISIMSMFGLVALAGIVVNDSLVLVDFINRHRYDHGDSIIEAVVNGCQKRFRPILMTSLTTFLGLFPIMLEQSTQAKFLIPMALSLGFGVLFATVICLVLVPAGIVIVDDIAKRFSKTPSDNHLADELNKQLETQES